MQQMTMFGLNQPEKEKKEGFNVLSLFNGMSTGMLAAKKVGLKIDNYFSSEVDKYAMQITAKNFPEIIEIGSVVEVDFKDGQLFNELGEVVFKGNIDLVIAGSPCQGFSLAGKQGGTNAIYEGESIIVSDLETYKDLKLKGAEFLSQSYLFWEFIDILNKIKKHNPNVKFMLENTKMNKANLEMISDTLGVESVLINSALVSAQNRERHYWANFEIKQPKDLGIMLNDIIETDEPVIGAAMRGRYTMNKKTKQFIELRKDGKANALTTVTKNSLCVEVGHADEIKGFDVVKRPTLTTIPGGHREPKIAIDEIMWRKLTPLECERLQTVPDGFTEGVSNSQRYKMLGNGWTVSVIAHILGGLK